MPLPGAAPVLLFDLMSTLVHDPFQLEMPAFFGMSLPELLACKHPTAWLRFETGELDEASFLKSFFHDGRAFDHAGFKDCVASAYRWLPGMRELMDDLNASGQRSYALSNYPSWYRLINERLELARVLESCFVSCNMGVRKPEREAFLIPTRRLGVEPAACLFVDDQRANCEAAAELGMDAILFEDATQLRGELVRRALLKR